MKPIHLLFWAAIASPLLAFLPSGQDPADTDWPKEVERACTAQRFGLRIAAAKKVAAAGAAAVPAVQAYAAKVGRNELPASLVEAIADADAVDTAVLELLHEWAADRDFYWRAAAMRGLARRAPQLADANLQRELFLAHRDDAAWLMRTHARFGLALLGDQSGLGLADSDPRVARKLTALLLQAGQLPPLQPLLDALVDERTCLGVPWGQHAGKEAFQALKNWLGDALPGGSTAFDDRRQGVAALLAAARQKSGQDLTEPVPRTDPTTPFTGGFEILSCRNGDQFVQWTADGLLCFGIDAATRVQLPAPIWDALSRKRATLVTDGPFGVVVCDNLRLRWTAPDVHTKVAPHALPADIAKWLRDLAEALAKAETADRAEPLRQGLEQFEPR